MKLAVYHNLPPGGALRAMCEYVLRLTPHATVDLYRPVDPSEGVAATALEGKVEERVNLVRTYEVPVPGHAYLPARAAAYGRMIGLVRLQRTIAAEIDAGRYDAVFVHPCQLTQTPALLSHLSMPSVYYMQEPRRATFEHSLRPPRSGSMLGPKAALKATVESTIARIDRQAASRATTVLANSSFSVESIYRAYGREATICPLGVDQDLFRPATHGQRIRQVLGVGALAPHKGYELLIDSVGALATDERPPIVIAYDRVHPEYRSSLERRARERRVALHLRSSLSDDDLVALYQTSMVTCCTAHLEPFGLTAIESLSCGTPVVAVREGGFREVVVDDKNGYLAERNTRHFADAIRKVLEGAVGHDAARLRDTVIPAWSWDRSTAVLVGILDQFTAERKLDA